MAIANRAQIARILPLAALHRYQNSRRIRRCFYSQRRTRHRSLAGDRSSPSCAVYKLVGTLLVPQLKPITIAHSVGLWPTERVQAASCPRLSAADRRRHETSNIFLSTRAFTSSQHLFTNAATEMRPPETSLTSLTWARRGSSSSKRL